MPRHSVVTYQNPFWQGEFPDPFILKVRGRYYAYATEHEVQPPAGSWVFRVLTSVDLVQWQELDKAMPALGLPYNRYWAPEVTEYNGKFYLYYAVHVTEFVGGIRVAVADHPAGPFIDSGYDITGPLTAWAIDPHVFRDQDGQRYLYMTVEYREGNEGFVGSGNAVDRLIDPFTLSGHLTRVTPPRHAWQLFERQRKERDGVDWYTVEGPSIIEHRGRYYETFSGGCYYRDNYAISYATSSTPMGSDGLRDSSWHDWEGADGNGVLVRGDAQLIGPGHNSLVLGPNNADLYLVYHAWPPALTARQPCLDRLFWHGDDLWTPAPTHTPQSAPALPRFREMFEEPVLRTYWRQQGGLWHLSPGEVLQQDTEGAALLHLQEQYGTNSLLEVNLRSLSGSGRYGLMLIGDEAAELRVLLAADGILELKAGADQDLLQASLPTDLALSAWHQLLLSLSGSVLSVRLDGMLLVETVLQNIPHKLALYTEQCSAAFSAISLTDHFRDEFLDERYSLAQLGWHERAQHDVNWHLQQGKLLQSSVTGEQIVLKGELSAGFEFGATMQLQGQHSQERPALGLLLWQNAEEQVFAGLTTAEQGWQALIEQNGSILGTYELPASFQPTAWHTLRLVYQDEQLALFLDGPQIMTMPLTLASGKTGLATRHTAAAFNSVWQTNRRQYDN